MENRTQKTFLDCIIGLLAGVVATGPMTIAMILWHRRLPAHERYPLPPREITMKLAREAGLAKKMSPEVRSAVSLLAHFAYGGAAGAIYGAVSEAVPAKSIWKGVGFGLLVWGASYLGYLPGTGILQSATKHPARRNSLMIGSHIVWGVVMSLAAGLFKEEADGGDLQPFSGRAKPHFDVKP